MLIKKIISIHLTCLICVFIQFGQNAYAENLLKDFPRIDSLEPKVEFWKLVFGRYGRNHSIFHHRHDPGIIYSIVDLTHLAEAYNDRAFEQKRKAEHEKEITRIQTALQNLAANNRPSNDFEKHIEAEFRKMRMNSSANYREAAKQENIRRQTGVKDKFEAGYIRSGRYLHSIEAIFKLSGLPIGLSRLPHVESSFNYEAYSSAAAAGIWQFIPSTGRQYMRVDRIIIKR